MKMFDGIKKFYDNVFGNNDGKFDLKDLPNGAPMIVAAVVDLVMLVAEYRVYSVGVHLTGNPILAIGFVAVSSIPFYLGQLAWLYNKANFAQKVTAVLMVLMGLTVSAYFGFADLMIGTTLELGNLVTDVIDLNALYFVAVLATVILILGGLFYGLVDDIIAQTLKANRIEGKFRVFAHELNVKSRMLEKATELKRQENALKSQYPEDYDELDSRFHPDRKPKEEDGSGKGSGNRSRQSVYPSVPSLPQEPESFYHPQIEPQEKDAPDF